MNSVVGLVESTASEGERKPSVDNNVNNSVDKQVETNLVSSSVNKNDDLSMHDSLTQLIVCECIAMRPVEVAEGVPVEVMVPDESQRMVEETGQVEKSKKIKKKRKPKKKNRG